ncbi:hypothetical protein PUN28_019691 [Cardiocondyla obscurior]|uniref:Uncharacterized protein n=1 Tax=Cardiocondyla obscurior TaxID=286306 RepID=A0AAW2EDZ7_9HYME
MTSSRRLTYLIARSVCNKRTFVIRQRKTFEKSDLPEGIFPLPTAIRHVRVITCVSYALQQTHYDNRPGLVKAKVSESKGFLQISKYCFNLEQFLYAAAPEKVAIDLSPRRAERPWSLQPPAPPSSPANREFSEEEEYLNLEFPRASSLSERSEELTDTDSEKFRPISPSFSPNLSENPDYSFPGAASRACSSSIHSLSPLPEETEEVGSQAENESVSWPEPDSPEPSPSPVPSVEFLEEQEEPREIVDPLLELLRRTCLEWTDSVPKRAYTVDPSHFHPEKIRRQASIASLDDHFFIYYPGVEYPFLAKIRLVDQVFPRTTVRVAEIIEIDLK